MSTLWICATVFSIVTLVFLERSFVPGTSTVHVQLLT